MSDEQNIEQTEEEITRLYDAEVEEYYQAIGHTVLNLFLDGAFPLAITEALYKQADEIETAFWDERDIGDHLEATFDPDEDIDALEGIEDVRGADSGTLTATETASIVTFDGDISENLPIGHGYEDDDSPERNTTWDKKTE